jgi:TIR domain
MAKAFLSYSSKDNNFVSLLVALLKFHHIDIWCSSSDIQPGAQFSLNIELALKDANVMLVVISKNAATSKWVTKEITTFKTQKNEALIVPLLLDSTSLDSIVPSLDHYQAIDFSQSMLAGCENLFSLLGKDFLSYQDRRNDLTRRIINNRRQGDRRESKLIQRMRLGFWKSYTQFTGRGEFEEITFDVRERLKVSDSLQGEICKYQYFDATHKSLDPKQVLETAVRGVWNMMKSRGTIKAVYLIEAIAEDICAQYNVEAHSERRNYVRRSTENRRKATIGV